MSLIITSTMNVGDIVTQYPQAADLFKKYKIDFCCGGNRPLHDAVLEKNLNENEIVQALNEGYEKMQAMNTETTNWQEVSSADLIDHVMQTHHAYLTDELPMLGQFVTKIYRVHGSNHSELGEVYNHFHDLSKELMEHIIKEDEVIFPLIKAYEADPTSEKLEEVKAAITELEKEHDHAGDLLKLIREITNDYELPVDACMTYTTTFQRLEALESDMFIHVHKENNILFPRFLNK
ncbi:iron-sulfur cluster repair di-iron protein [Schinkia azotoformans]|uniref:iron-sulfur cluster repair di-iron protein n=1 Tax=Schinkia azotoformans TaxID=1454 RepID=UPI002DBEEDDB|nr:iron-sulfur cluster repair di-iron protein [Schinkia azotoformans]MEC1740302.1 iron-sulfur cluster repair di-iron protein [Schinkia azotoformans]MEC1747182.1 iron-sulfur cluster repair di-iron protein [Schinkia azotoformans]MEC1757415.1 iron-sulfur cluster repair di-iron protein [Schinkia azotoformans]MEC1768965.1 iron-sulfur cluster repair di-iron protein [Schinkia azotoformans]MEC1788310.1 iron-sulfur cluster repair di-iron protein [Schinkia azotoformans]